MKGTDLCIILGCFLLLGCPTEEAPAKDQGSSLPDAQTTVVTTLSVPPHQPTLVAEISVGERIPSIDQTVTNLPSGSILVAELQPQLPAAPLQQLVLGSDVVANPVTNPANGSILVAELPPQMSVVATAPDVSQTGIGSVELPRAFRVRPPECELWTIEAVPSHDYIELGRPMEFKVDVLRANDANGGEYRVTKGEFRSHGGDYDAYDVPLQWRVEFISPTNQVVVKEAHFGGRVTFDERRVTFDEPGRWFMIAYVETPKCGVLDGRPQRISVVEDKGGICYKAVDDLEPQVHGANQGEVVNLGFFLLTRPHGAEGKERTIGEVVRARLGLTDPSGVRTWIVLPSRSYESRLNIPGIWGVEYEITTTNCGTLRSIVNDGNRSFLVRPRPEGTTFLE